MPTNMNLTSHPSAARADGVLSQQVGLPLTLTSIPGATKTAHRNVPGLKGIAATHLGLGSCSTILGIVAVILRCHASYLGFGIWSGVLFFCVTGIIGLLAAHKKNRGLEIAYLVMSILSTVLAFQLLVAAAVSAGAENNYSCLPRGAYPPYYTGPCIVSERPRIAVDSLLAIVGLAEMVINIVGASLGCYGICGCCTNSYSPVVVHYGPEQTGALLVPQMPMQAQQQQQPGMQFAPMNVQQQPQQQQIQPARVAEQGSFSGSMYVTGYSATPTQPIANALQRPVGPAPQQMMYAPQPVGGTPQQVLISPQQVVIGIPGQAPPGQAPPTVSVAAGRQTAENPDPHADHTDHANMGGGEHFHHDEKQGLLDTA